MLYGANPGVGVIRSPYSRVAPPGSAEGTARLNQFVSDLLEILGPCEGLWIPGITDTTTSGDKSRNARTLTYQPAALTGGMTPQGSGVYANFAVASSEYATTPDVDGLSFLTAFGAGADDDPFSAGILVKCADYTLADIQALYSKWDATTASPKREWGAEIGTAGKFAFFMFDESSDGQIGVTYDTALTDGSPYLLGHSYDGGAQELGIKAYVNGARKATVTNSSGTYTAMENLAVAGQIGARILTTGSYGRFLGGGVGLAFVTRKQLLDDDWWRINVLTNAFFSLTLS